MRLTTVLSALVAVASVAALDSRAALRAGIRKNAVHPPQCTDATAFRVLGRQVGAQCTSLCSSASDVAATNGLAGCSQTDIACLCTYLFEITPNCLSCVIATEGVSLGELQSACAAATMSGTDDGDSVTITGLTSSVSGTGTASSALPTTTEAPCTQQCSSASDTAAGEAAGQCAEDDTECICTTAAELSPSCLSCILDEDGVDATEFAQACSAIESSAVNTATATRSGSAVSSSASRVSSSSVKPSATGSQSSASRSSSSVSASASPSQTRSAALRNFAGDGVLALVSAILAALLHLV